MAHDAFISYSHSADGELAPRVQDGLQRLAKPWWRRRSLHVFRDTTGLSANPGLWSSIESSMDDSDWFVFLASPESASSPWVERELAHWLDTRGPDQVLPVLTDGTWVWDDETGDFDLAASTAVPAALVGVFAEEPRHVDLSWARTEEQLDLRNGRFRDQVAELAAPMHGMAKDDLVGADVREHRRTLRAAWGAAAALLLLLAASIVGGIAAVKSADEAATQRAEAVRRASEAESARADATRSADDARNQKKIAEDAAVYARAAQQEAEDSAELADRRRDEADASRRQADDARADAETSEAEAVASRQRAERSADAEQAAADLARAREGEANEQTRIATENEQKANREQARAEQLARVAEREKAAAERSEDARAEQARRARSEAADARKARDQAQAAERDAQVAKESAEKALASEAEQRQLAETEALASASRSQGAVDGALSLLLAVESADRGAGPIVPPGRAGSSAASAATTRGDAATGRRALFEAVTAAKGGTDRFPVERYLSWPASVADPPVHLHLPTVSPDGRYLAAAEIPDEYRGNRVAAPTRVFLWDLHADRTSVRVLEGHQDAVTFVHFAGGGRTLVTTDVPDVDLLAATTRIWDVATGAQVAERFGFAYVSPTDEHIVIQSWVFAGDDDPDLEVQVYDGSGTWLRRIAGRVAADPNASERVGRPQPAFREPFTSDGEHVLLEVGGSAALWDLSSGELLALPSPYGGKSAMPRMLPDGSGVVVVEDDVYLGWWSIDRSDAGLELAYQGFSGTPHEARIRSLVWSPTGRYLATLDTTGYLFVVDFEQQRAVWAQQFDVQGEIVFAEDEASIAFAYRVPVDETHDERRTAILFNASGSIGLLAGDLLATDAAGRMYIERPDRTLSVARFFDAVGPDLLGPIMAADGGLEARPELYSSAIAPDRSSIGVTTSEGVQVHDLLEPGFAGSAGGSSQAILGLAFAPDARTLAGVGISGLPVVWDVVSVGAGEVMDPLVPGSTVLSDGVTAVEPLDDRSGVRFRDLATGVVRSGPSLRPGEQVDYVVASSERELFAVNLRGESGGSILAWSDGSVVGRTSGQIVTISRDGTRLVERGAGDSVRVLRSSDLEPVGEVSLAVLADGLTNLDRPVVLDPTGRLLASSNAAGRTVVWDTATGAVVADLAGSAADSRSYPLYGLSFSPDGSGLVVKSPSNLVRRYDVSTWKIVATQQLRTEFAGRVVFNPSGDLLTIDGLTLLDGRSLAPITELASGPAAVTRFSADGAWLVTVEAGEFDDPTPRAVTRWSTSVEDLRREACRIAGRSLTEEERSRFAVPLTSRSCG